MKDLLTDKVVLVSGGTQGLGAGIARAAAREGALVVVAGRNATRGEQVVAELVASGHEASFVAADISVSQLQAAALGLEVVRDALGGRDAKKVVVVPRRIVNVVV